jgi:hypothetical protein
MLGEHSLFGKALCVALQPFTINVAQHEEIWAKQSRWTPVHQLDIRPLPGTLVGPAWFLLMLAGGSFRKTRAMSIEG